MAMQRYIEPILLEKATFMTLQISPFPDLSTGLVGLAIDFLRKMNYKILNLQVATSV